MISAVLFDLDGVLMETELETFRFYQAELKQRYGVALPNNHFRFKAGRKSVDFWRDALTDEQRRRVDTTALTAYKRERFAAEPERYIRRVPGGRELLSTLRRHRVPLALASQNEPRVINAAVSWLGVREFFTVVLTIADIKNLKPDPEIYLLAARKLNVTPAACAVIEDSLDGVGAAKNAGMRCIAIRHPYTPQGHLDCADVIVDALAALSWPIIRGGPGSIQPRKQKDAADGDPPLYR